MKNNTPNIRDHLTTLNLKNSILFYAVLFWGVVGLTTLFNYGNQFLDWKPILLWILNSAEFIVLGSASLFLIIFRKKLGQNFTKILAFIIIGSIFIVLNFDSSVMDNLWNKYNFPAKSIFTGIPYVQPLDPFQHIVLFPIFLGKKYCENILKTIFSKFRVG